MKKFLSASALLLLTAFMAISSPAQEKQIDFDSEEGITAIISQAMPKLQKDRIRAIQSLKHVGTMNKAGVYVPSLGANILQNPSYISAKQYPPLLEHLEPMDREPLKAAWSDIENEKNILNEESVNIDSSDTALYQETGPLNREKAALEQKQQTLNGDIDRYNSECTGRPLPPEEYKTCTARRAALLDRVQVLNREIDAYNVKVEAWQGRLLSLKAKSSVLSGKIPPWAEKINKFVKSAEEALSRSQMTSVRVQAQGGGLEQSVRRNELRPVTLIEGNSMLDELWLKLTPRQQEQRTFAFEQARAFMLETAVVGGVIAPPIISRSFFNQNPNPSDARVDVEIFRGRAFVSAAGNSR